MTTTKGQNNDARTIATLLIAMITPAVIVCIAGLGHLDGEAIALMIARVLVVAAALIGAVWR